MRDILYRDVPSFEANECNSGKLFTAYVYMLFHKWNATLNIRE